MKHSHPNCFLYLAQLHWATSVWDQFILHNRENQVEAVVVPRDLLLVRCGREVMEMDNDMTDRRHWTMKEFAVLFTLLMNFGALIWGAAKIDSAVENLQSAVAELKVGYSTFDSRVRFMEREHAELLTRVRNLENK